MACELCAIETKNLAAILVPVGQHPTFNYPAVDTVLMSGRQVRMPMDKGGVMMFAQEHLRGCGVEIHFVRTLMAEFFFLLERSLCKRSAAAMAFLSASGFPRKAVLQVGLRTSALKIWYSVSFVHRASP